MKKQFLLLTLCAVLFLPAQSQSDFFSRLMNESIILSKDGLAKKEKGQEAFLSNFKNENGAVTSYEKQFNIEVSPSLSYEIGEIKTGASSFAVMFLNKSEGGIEFLTIYEKTASDNQQSAIDQSRTQWMEICNAHKAGELVEKMYTSDAYYYNRGRLLQGTSAITTEYGYMNNPNYSLKLTPKHLKFVSSDIAYEIGQCSGSYNNPYMLLWQKQADGSWQVLMDSND